MTRRDPDRYWALVKFEVSADHFERAYSFVRYVGNGPLAVAGAIAAEFLRRVDEALSAEEEPDDDVGEERLDMERRLSASVAASGMPGAGASLAKLRDEICIGYPSYAFRVIAEGRTPRFLAAVLSALEDDEDFATFLELHSDPPEDADEAPDKEKRALAARFQKLLDGDPAKLTAGQIGSLLDRVEALVTNDEM